MNFVFNYSLVTSVYLYLTIFVFFFLFYQDIARNQHVGFFADLHGCAADRWRKVVFMVLLVSFLGTPVTLGFFYKINVFNVLANSSLLAAAGATLLNLIMLVFYLQAARQPQMSRKKKVRRLPQDVNTSTKANLTAYTGFSALALIFAPVLIDIIMALIG